MVHVSLIFQSNIGSTDNLKSSFVVPGGERPNSSLGSLSIAISVFYISSVRVIGGVVALTKDPESIPSHGVGSVVPMFIKIYLIWTVVHGI